MWRISSVVVGCVCVTGICAAPVPTWWSAPDTQIIQAGLPQSDSSPVSLGQLKFVATQAKKHLDAKLPGGAGTTIANTVAAFKPVARTSYSPQQLQQIRKDNFAPASLAQLKVIALPFYDRLNAAGFNTKQNLKNRGYPDKWSGPTPWAGSYPWNPATPVAENMAPASLAQLKMVFSFDLTNFQAGDADGNQIPDSWENQYFGGLGTSVETDSDGDGVSNLVEFQRGLSPKNPDSDFDGIGDSDEIARETDPLDSNSKDNKRIAYFPFDAPDWRSAEGALPSEATGSQVDGFKGKGLLIDAESEVHVYPWLRPDGRPNYSIRQGTVRMWFKPNWSSPAMSNYWSRLFQMGVWTGDASLGAIILHFKAAEPGVFYTTHDGNGHGAFGDFTLASNSIVSGKWHQIAISYSPTSRKLYFNGVLIANQSVNWNYDPDVQDILGWGLRFGNDWGSYLNGTLDEVEVFNYQLSDTDVSSNYAASAPGVDSDLDGLPDAWEQANLGGLAQDGTGNPDNDGLTNLQEYLHRTNPQVADTDGDDVNDGIEVGYGMRPTDYRDALEDADGDRYPNIFEIKNASNPIDPNSIPGNHVVVEPNTSSSSIETAINSRPVGEYSVIFIRKGDYYESISITGNKKVFVYGELGSDLPRLYSWNPQKTTANTYHRTVYIQSSAGQSVLASFDGLDFQGATEGFRGREPRRAFDIKLSTATQQVRLSNCIVRNHWAEYYGSVAYLTKGELTVVHSTLCNNYVGEYYSLSNTRYGKAIHFDAGGLASPNGAVFVINSILWNKKGGLTREIGDGTSAGTVQNPNAQSPNAVTVVNSVVDQDEYGVFRINPKLDRYAGIFGDSPARSNGATGLANSKRDRHGEARGAVIDIGADQHTDTDSDGIPDWWEKKYFPSLAVTTITPFGDLDSDRLPNYQEYLLGFDPTNTDTLGRGRGDLMEAVLGTTDPWYPTAWRQDGDGDGLSDGLELALGADPTGKDSNGDGLLDGNAFGSGTTILGDDSDGDGLSNGQEILARSNPFVRDTDGDGIEDLLDLFPNDPARSNLFQVSGDVDGPVITLQEPGEAVHMP